MARTERFYLIGVMVLAVLVVLTNVFFGTVLQLVAPNIAQHIVGKVCATVAVTH